MPGRIILEPKASHVCTGKPPTDGYRKGTQWQCSECRQTWVLVYGSQYNEHYEVWRELNLKNINGEDEF